MRFIKRRNRSLPPRRTENGHRDATDEPVEHSADLSDDERDASMPAPDQEDSLGTGDPIQRLLTALGRFQRCVAKGQTGVQQEVWCDDCMNQLIVAIETSLARNWGTIVEPLTDTARILHSYEQSGCAHLCIPFLSDSYEILCLMVSDLIVDNVRSGVIEKWRERYRRAVGELNAAGLTLVQDEDEEESPREEASRESEPIPFEEPAPDSPPAQAPNVAPSLDEFLPASETAPQKAAPEVSETIEQTAAKEVEDRGRPSEAPPEAGETMTAQTELDVVRILDSVCEELSQLAKTPGADGGAARDAIVERVIALERYAGAKGQEAAEQICRRMAEICQVALRKGYVPTDRFFDAAYAFCEAYVEADRESDSLLALNWYAESDRLLGELEAAGLAVQETHEEAPPAPETPAPEAVAPTPEAPPPDTGEDTPGSLLVAAQQAMARGDFAGAKVLTLQAAAQMARAEAGKIEVWVQEAEKRFKENEDLTERARGHVKKAEQDVVVAEATVAEAESELNDVRARAVAIGEKTQDVEREIAEIDEQMRALQEARTAALERAQATQAELENVRNEERQFGQELESIRQAEDKARALLEGARQNVKDLDRKRLELEGALLQARETLTRQRTSLADIERTLNQFSGPGGPGPGNPADMLF